jgi:hypothetical protein
MQKENPKLLLVGGERIFVIVQRLAGEKWMETQKGFSDFFLDLIMMRVKVVSLGSVVRTVRMLKAIRSWHYVESRAFRRCGLVPAGTGLAMTLMALTSGTTLLSLPSLQLRTLPLATESWSFGIVPPWVVFSWSSSSARKSPTTTFRIGIKY